jgi:hypothetical protein
MWGRTRNLIRNLLKVNLDLDLGSIFYNLWKIGSGSFFWIHSNE